MKWPRRALVWSTITLLMSAAGPSAAESLVKRLLRISGLTASPSQMRGPDEIANGEVWVTDVERGTTAGLTRAGGYRWPVFFPNTGDVLALQADKLVRIAPDGSASTVRKLENAIKLVGFDKVDPDLVLVLVRGSADRSPLALFSFKSGRTTLLPYDRSSSTDRRMLEHVRGQERVYGGTSVYVKVEREEGLTGTSQWTDVYLKPPDVPPRNVSKCSGVNCSQPSLSPDGSRIVFIREVDGR